MTYVQQQQVMGEKKVKEIRLTSEIHICIFICLANKFCTSKNEEKSIDRVL